MRSSRRKRIILWSILIPAFLAAAGILLFRFGGEGIRSVFEPVIAIFSDPDTETPADPEDTEAPQKVEQQEISADETPTPYEPDTDEEVHDPSETIQLEDQSSTPPLLSSPSPTINYSITELLTDGELQLLTGGSTRVVYYRQSDERWGQLPYGSDKISTHGCGPTAMAMVVSTLTDTIIDPPSMAQWAVEHGYWARRSGSYHSIVIGTATSFGLKAEAFLSRDADSLREQLLSGKLLVALMGPGHFTQSGHFIILRGVTLSGGILVADPGSIDRSLTVWDAQLLLDELSRSTVDGSPLWLISVPENTAGE